MIQSHKVYTVLLDQSIRFCVEENVLLNFPFDVGGQEQRNVQLRSTLAGRLN